MQPYQHSGGLLTRVLRQQDYNDSNQLTGQSWQIGTTSYSEAYTYNEKDGSLNTMTTATGQTVNYTYDALRRLEKVDTGLYSYEYDYRNIPETTQTTTQVEALSYTGISGNLNFSYTYDALGNIATYSDYNGSQSYTYDKLGQLTQVVVGAKTYSYVYDPFGNIVSKGDGTVSHAYTYGNAQWEDLLTAYDGQTISYDGSGNPTSYYNGNRWSFAWEEGRNLVTAASNGKSYSYTYDHEGVRTSKTVNGVTHSYIYASGKLLRETIDNGTDTTSDDTILDFFYDTNGRPYAMKMGNNVYYYILNLQGDVMKLVTSSGSVAASYKYDPYGKLLSTDGDMAYVNPLRYRGYYYDTETGLYYVSSRYYDPEMGRFINADDTSFLGINGSLLSYNLYVYCGNNPIMGYDPYGEFDVIGAVAGGLVGAAISMTSYVLTSGGDIDVGELLWAGAVGATSGICASVSIKGALVAGVINGVYTAITTEGDLIDKVISGVISFGCTFAGGAVAFSGCDKLLNCVKSVSNLAYGLGSAFINYTVGETADAISLGVQSIVSTVNTSNNQANDSIINRKLYNMEKRMSA